MRGLPLALSLLSFTTLAFADKKVDKKACSDSYEKAQVMQKASRLNDERAELTVCTQDACPKWIQTECVKWLADIDEHQPSLVIAAKDSQGHDVLDASIEIDGSMISSKLDGSPIRVDPGQHTIKITPDGQAATEMKVVARWGEKSRVVPIILGASSNATSEPPPAGTGPKRGSMVPAIAVAGLGVVALGVSIGVGLSGKADADDMRTRCAPNCLQSDIDAANTKLLVSDVLTGVGIAGIAAGVLLFIFRPTVKETSAFVFEPRRGGATLGLRF
jgi:hypothetical protein